MSGIYPASIMPGENGGPANGLGVTLPVNASSISDLFSTEMTSATDTGQSEAEATLATGDTGEATAYSNAAAIAAANARLATVGGTVEQAQQQVQLGQTLGAQRAAIAGGGFQEAGSGLNILRASTQQGRLEQQITGVNASLQAGGFEEQQAASVAEETAAQTASSEANVLSSNFASQASQSKTNAALIASAMNVSPSGQPAASNNFSDFSKFASGAIF